jgi:outer membrane murein-binding lipoprotein Lpp
MGFFGEDKAIEIQSLKDALKLSEERRKKVAAAFAAEQKKAVELKIQVEAMKAEVQQLKAAVMKARQRQKASVDRANRYKSRLTNTTIAATVDL